MDYNYYIRLVPNKNINGYCYNIVKPPTNKIESQLLIRVARYGTFYIVKTVHKHEELTDVLKTTKTSAVYLNITDTLDNIESELDYITLCYGDQFRELYDECIRRMELKGDTVQSIKERLGS